MKRILIFTYGVVCYAVFLATFLCTVGFLGNFGVSHSIDETTTGPLGAALLIDALLLLGFALQHSVMARPAFKAWWTRIVPTPAERSTYVLFSSLALLLLFWQWRPIGLVVWDVPRPAARAAIHVLFAVGWLAVLGATCLINHFDLFGLRQVWLYLLGREHTSVRFTAPGPYQYVRHPLYVGWLIVFWAAPTMTVAHLVFALGTTAYILVAIQFEERDLLAAHGRAYAAYRERVPMLLPRLSWRSLFSRSAPRG